jgi:hypothetical protein
MKGNPHRLACPVCRAEELRPVFVRRPDADPILTDLYQCFECGTYFVDRNIRNGVNEQK